MSWRSWVNCFVVEAFIILSSVTLTLQGSIYSLCTRFNWNSSSEKVLSSRLIPTWMFLLSLKFAILLHVPTVLIYSLMINMYTVYLLILNRQDHSVSSLTLSFNLVICIQLKDFGQTTRGLLTNFPTNQCPFWKGPLQKMKEQMYFIFSITKRLHYKSWSNNSVYLYELPVLLQQYTH